MAAPKDVAHYLGKHLLTSWLNFTPDPNISRSRFLTPNDQCYFLKRTRANQITYLATCFLLFKKLNLSYSLDYRYLFEVIVFYDRVTGYSNSL